MQFSQCFFAIIVFVSILGDKVLYLICESMLTTSVSRPFSVICAIFFMGTIVLSSFAPSFVSAQEWFFDDLFKCIDPANANDPSCEGMWMWLESSRWFMTEAQQKSIQVESINDTEIVFSTDIIKKDGETITKFKVWDNTSKFDATWGPEMWEELDVTWVEKNGKMHVTVKRADTFTKMSDNTKTYYVVLMPVDKDGNSSYNRSDESFNFIPNQPVWGTDDTTPNTWEQHSSAFNSSSFQNSTSFVKQQNGSTYTIMLSWSPDSSADQLRISYAKDDSNSFMSPKTVSMSSKTTTINVEQAWKYVIKFEPMQNGQSLKDSSGNNIEVRLTTEWWLEWEQPAAPAPCTSNCVTKVPTVWPTENALALWWFVLLWYIGYTFYRKKYS